jgi:5-methylcytosine-specific restriction endonuclease McrA
MKINRQEVLDKYDGHCAYCGDEIILQTMQVDHIRPKLFFEFGCEEDIPDYGVDDIENLNPSCRKCNNFKNVWSIEEFRRELEAQVGRARKYSVNFRMAEKFNQIQINEQPIIFYFEKKLRVNKNVLHKD